MNYKIISDSCCDHQTDGSRLSQIHRVPLDITLDERSYPDDESLDVNELLKDMKGSPNPPRSSCPSPEKFIESFEGEERDIYVVTLSDKLSGSYNSAVLAKKIYSEEKSGKNIHVFNTRSASAGQVAVCLKIKELAESGKSFGQVVAETESFINGLTTFFVLEDLEVLRKNGRLSNIQAMITGALKIKLIMSGRPDGTIAKKGQAFSMQQALDKMVGMIAEQTKKIDCTVRNLVITHCNCPERAAALRDAVLKKCRFMSDVVCRAGGISTIYANSGGIVVSF